MTTCPECGHSSLYASDEVSTRGVGGLTLLPGLENIFTYGKLKVVICEDCGLMRLYASSDARKKLSDSGKWHKL